MTKKKKSQNRDRVIKILPYFLCGLLIIGIAFFGSLNKQSSETSLSLDSFIAKDYDVSVDQLSELYVVADLSDALGLASASDVASNYVITTTMYDSGQTASSGKLEKPSITDVKLSRGIREYTVEEGEDIDDIARRFNISADDIRWSNNLKTVDVAEGTVLYIPSTSGIVYTVKSGDTIDSIVDKYGSNSAEIIALNDLENSEITEGMRIIIKGGSLPETERPEYVAPTPRRTTTTTRTNNYSYTYLGSTSERQNIEVVGYFYNLGGPYGRGQCTQWAWYKRQDLPSSLGNANAWARNAAAAGFVVNRTPSAGAVFQTSSGWYGHVGYVESVNSDGSIVVTEMNYGVNYRVIRSTIPASYVGNFNYIH